MPGPLHQAFNADEMLSMVIQDIAQAARHAGFFLAFIRGPEQPPMIGRGRPADGEQGDGRRWWGNSIIFNGWSRWVNQWGIVRQPLGR